MAPPSRRAAPAVEKPTSLRAELFAHIGRFDFVQAVRLLQRLRPDRQPVGGHASPGDEVVRFRSDVSAVFPKAELTRIAPPADEAPVELEVAFMGVATPASFGSLPRRYAEEIRALLRRKNPVLRDFLDLFNHRLVSLFFRARERHYPALLFERGEDSPFEKALAAVLGLGTRGLSQRLALPDRALFARAGLLAMRPMPARALEALLESVFQVPARIVQFCPARYTLEPDDQNRLGRRNVRLGEDFMMGEEIRIADARFRVRLGPLDRGDYTALLPDRPSFRELTDLVRFATRGDQEFDVQLVLAPDEPCFLRLGTGDQAEGRLGWSSWCRGSQRQGARDDAVITPPTPTSPREAAA